MTRINTNVHPKYSFNEHSWSFMAMNDHEYLFNEHSWDFLDIRDVYPRHPDLMTRI